MKRPLHGLVLAGGRSERMGRDKAALVHPDGRPLARRTHDLLVAAGCAEVYLSLREEQALPPGFEDKPEVPVIRDTADARGPLAGMLAAMRATPDADWLVVACDLPRLGLETLTALLLERRAGEPFLAFRSSSDELPEPLCAVYGAEALPILEEAVRADLRCPRKILIRENARLLEPVDERALDNANTPDDWERATD